MCVFLVCFFVCVFGVCFWVCVCEFLGVFRVFRVFRVFGGFRCSGFVVLGF